MAQVELAERWRFPLRRQRPAPRGEKDEAPADSTPASDEQLMVRVGRDDTTALGELFDRYRPRLFVFLLRVVGDRSMAEDLVQEVFWRLWERRTYFGADRQFSGWLYTIARRLAWNEVQRASHRTMLFSELSETEQQRVEAGDAATSQCLPEERILAADHRSSVRAALRTLPPDQRLCLVLREYEGRSHHEIGEIMGCSEGKARVLAHRARRALRPLLVSLFESEEEPCGNP